MAGKSPTSRSLEYLRKNDWTAQVVERRLPHANTTVDLYGFIDILAIRNGQVLAVQTTSGDNVAARIRKIAESEHVAKVRECGWMIHVHGWRKNAKGRWELREVDVS